MMSRPRHLINAARAAALFSSDLSAWHQPTPDRVEAAIRQAVCRYGGVRHCQAEVATAYGEHPETAVARMRWARQIVEGLYPGSGRLVDGGRLTPERIPAPQSAHTTAA